MLGVSMGARADRIVPELQVLALLKARPAALGQLESWGIDPWEDPGARLDTLAASLRLPWPEFVSRLADPPPGAAGADPASASLPELLERLVADHRKILEELAPAVRAALGRLPGGETGASAGLAEAWDAFTSGLETHMREEETFLFPRLLHYAHCLRRSSPHPDFTGGSVNVYIAIRLLGNEHLQMDALRRFLSGRNALALASGKGSPEQEALARALAAFQAGLERHNQVEEGILYPKARGLEKTLYDAAIAGGDADAAPAADR